MTAPARVDVTLDEIEEQLKTQDDQAKADAEAAKAADAAKAAGGAAAAAPVDPRVKQLEDALRISEESRLRQAAAASPPEPKIEEVPKLTDEELAELMQKNPVAAVKYMQAEATRVAESNLDKRLKPLLGGTADAQEASARARFPDEFAVFGKEITEFINQLPDKSVLTQQARWDDLIAWMRGRPGNFERLVEFKGNKNKGDAQAAQAAAAGATVTSTIRTPQAAGGKELDATAKEIAKTMGMSEADYIKWRDVIP